MRVTLVAQTSFNAEIAYDLTEWEGEWPGNTPASLLTEFSGRACYQSWTKPNPATAHTTDYISHIIDVGHLSIFEHGTATFYIENVSRSLTHEFIRHRHLSPSQESQRYVKLTDEQDPVIPPLYRGDWEFDDRASHTYPVSRTQEILESVWADVLKAYDELVNIWEQKLAEQGVTGTSAKKEAREAARCVLPNMTPTRIVMTGNHRAWRHFLMMRGSLHADAEIRELALDIFQWLRQIEPALYQDIYVQYDDRGRGYLGRVGVPE